MSHGSVTALSVTPIKGTRLLSVDSVELGPTGALGDRRFFVIDDRSRMVNGKQLGELQQVIATFDERAGTLTLAFPDGSVVQDTIEEREAVEARFYSETLTGATVGGPFAEALSGHLGQTVRLVGSATALDRGERGAVSLISRGSIERLAAEAGVDSVDARRFRMLVEVDGLHQHAEDRWVNRSVKIGEAVVHFEGHVGRCMITSRDPDTGIVDLPTLDLLRSYRGLEPSMEALPFGVFGRVVRPGTITIGDRVAPI